MVAVAVDEYVTFGRKAQLHPPAAVVAAAAVSEYSTSSGLCSASRRCPGVHALGDDRSSLILARIAAGKEDVNDTDADNKIKSDLSHRVVMACVWLAGEDDREGWRVV